MLRRSYASPHASDNLRRYRTASDTSGASIPTVRPFRSHWANSTNSSKSSEASSRRRSRTPSMPLAKPVPPNACQCHPARSASTWCSISHAVRGLITPSSASRAAATWSRRSIALPTSCKSAASKNPRRKGALAGPARKLAGCGTTRRPRDGRPAIASPAPAAEAATRTCESGPPRFLCGGPFGTCLARSCSCSAWLLRAIVRRQPRISRLQGKSLGWTWPATSCRAAFIFARPY